jgi:hypothetical protein
MLTPHLLMQYDCSRDKESGRETLAVMVAANLVCRGGTGRAQIAGEEVLCSVQLLRVAPPPPPVHVFRIGVVGFVLQVEVVRKVGLERTNFSVILVNSVTSFCWAYNFVDLTPNPALG